MVAVAPVLGEQQQGLVEHLMGDEEVPQGMVIGTLNGR
jgi:hypothetical protein